jgi:hypothetical protein
MTGAAPVRPRRPSVLTSPPTAGPAAVRTTLPPVAVAPTARTKPRRERQTKAAAFRAQISPRAPVAESTEVHVAAATTACQRCHSAIEVICVHCTSGRVSGEPLDRFTVSDVWAINDSLARQLGRWPNYRKVIVQNAEDGYFANHCPNCGAPQDDMYLHSEPDEIFFDIPSAAAGSIELTPLAGSIQLSGDEHFQVD